MYASTPSMMSVEGSMTIAAPLMDPSLMPLTWCGGVSHVDNGNRWPAGVGAAPYGGDMSDRAPALSPSRASDFKQCPLMYRYRAVDRLPEPPSAAATLGTLVHAVLEDLFGLPADSRTEPAAIDMVVPQWDKMLTEQPELAALHASDAAEAQWLGDARERLRTYFEMENPARIEPDGRELLVEIQLEDGPLLAGDHRPR